MVLAGISIGKLQIQFGFLSITCELCTKIGPVRDPSECADASKVATECRSDACGSYLLNRCLPP